MSYLQNNMFQGLFTAVVTPFSGGEFDESAYRKLIKHILAGGADGIVPNGTTGENPTLTDDERERVIRIAVEMCRDFGAKVIAGAGTNDTAKTVKLISEAADWGADGALVITPYYNKPTQDGLLLHFRRAAEDSPLPIVMYNVPARTGVNLTAETAVSLSREMNIAGLKEAAGDLIQFAEIARKTESGFTVLSGDDGLTLPSLAIGGNGVISVAGNIVPKLMKEMLNAWNTGKSVAALEIHHRLMPLFKALFMETSPAPCKKALELMGICSAEVRAPLSGVKEDTSKSLREALDDLNVDLPGFK